MAKKKPAPKRGASRYQAPAKKTSVPGWVWLVAGLAIGGFIMFLTKLEPGRNDVRRSLRHRHWIERCRPDLGVTVFDLTRDARD